MQSKPQRLMRRPAVLAARGRSNASHHNDIKAGLFTPPVRIGPNSVAWPEDEVSVLNAARIAGRSDDEIRVLVKELLAARTQQAIAIRAWPSIANGSSGVAVDDEMLREVPT